MQILSWVRRGSGVLLLTVLCAASFSVHAGVKSMLRVKNDAGNDELVRVVCTNSRLTPMIVRNDGENQWCGVVNSEVCASTKLSMAKKACKNKYLQAVSAEGVERESEIVQQEVSKVEDKAVPVSKPNEPKAESVDKTKAEAQIAQKEKAAAEQQAELEKARLEIERESLQIEREKVALEREELELMKLEMELERKTKTANGNN